MTIIRNSSDLAENFERKKELTIKQRVRIKHWEREPISLRVASRNSIREKN